MTYDFAAEGIDIDRAHGGPCVEWTGPFFANGRARHYSNGEARTQIAARRIYEDANGVRLTRWQLVCHHCDNPKCVRLSHLFVGSPADNMADKVKKGRQAKGEQISSNQRNRTGESHPNAKLTAEAVRQIRSIAAEKTRYGRAEIARRFGVSESLVKQIANGRGWKHV